MSVPSHEAEARAADLESHARLDLIREHISHGLVEVDEDPHSQLGLDAALGDEVIERVCEGIPEAALCQWRGL